MRTTTLVLLALFSVAAVAEPAYLLPLIPGASDQRWGGVARIFNGYDRDVTVIITGYDDAGSSYGPVSLSIDEGATVHLNSYDFEHGNASKGLPAGLGDGEGDWYLYLRTSPDDLGSDLNDRGLVPLAYIRTVDGLLTAMHDRVSANTDGEYVVGFFNPGSNVAQVSRLRVINPNTYAVVVRIVAKDDAPARYHEDEDDGWVVAGPVSFDLGPRAVRTVSARELESGGEGLSGRLGDGQGKWRLVVSAEHPSRNDWSLPLVVVSLLASPTGHLSNLSTSTPEPVDVPVDCTGEYVTIPDAALRRAVARALGLDDSGEVPTDAMAGLVDLDAAASLPAESLIEDLTGLECATRLRSLNLTNNEVTDISPLAGLATLVSLNLGNNGITDISALEHLTALEWLNLDAHRTTDVSPLAGLTALNRLSLSGNQIGDISALAGMAELDWLQLQDNSIEDVSVLAGLLRLRGLILHNNRVDDVSALAGLTTLWRLGLNGNQIVDVSPLAGLTALEWLPLSYNRISDIAPLVFNTGLDEGDRVELTGNPLNAAAAGHIRTLEARGVEVVY